MSAGARVIGPGTLYRISLPASALEAVYRTEVEKLAREREFTESRPQVEALRAWMFLVWGLYRTKQLIAPALNKIGADLPRYSKCSGDKITGAIRDW